MTVPLPADILEALAAADKEEQQLQQHQGYNAPLEAEETGLSLGRKLAQIKPFAGSCSCWRCPNGTQNKATTRSIQNAVCMQATAGVVRTYQAAQLVFIAPGGCLPEGEEAVQAAVRNYLVDQRASVSGTTTTCIEDAGTPEAAAAAIDPQARAAAVGVSDLEPATSLEYNATK